MYPSCPLFSSLPPTIRAVLRSGAKSSAITSMPSLKSVQAGPSSISSTNLGGSAPRSTSGDTSDVNTTVRGWIRSVRGHKNVSFAAVSDGSTRDPLQAVFKGALPDDLTVGSSVELRGQLKASKGKGQDIEFLVQQTKILGTCDTAEYPIQKKNLPTKVLRDHAHLRFRTTQMSAVMSLRDGMMRDWHDWFEANEFTYVHTPILTSSDCEGAGETFSLSNCGTPSASTSGPSHGVVSASGPSSMSPPTSSETITPASGQLFPHPVNLTVSSQLHLEAPTHALGRTYTLSPCFRAEPSATSRHLAEFYMLEGEVAFVQTLDELMDIVEDSIRWTLRELLHGTSARSARLRDNLAAIHRSREQQVDESQEENEDEAPKRNVMAELDVAVNQPFTRIDYTTAITKLQARHTQHPFAQTPVWGEGLPLEQEKWLAEDAGGPIFVTHYPATLKPFYMLPSAAFPTSSASSNGPTVACFDLLLPNLGEIAGGSLREHRLPQLLSSISQHGLSEEDYGWYLDLRRYGSVPHGGWGMGWDRWISWVSGVGNVKDVVAFPRWLGQCKY